MDFEPGGSVWQSGGSVWLRSPENLACSPRRKIEKFISQWLKIRVDASGWEWLESFADFLFHGTK